MIRERAAPDERRSSYTSSDEQSLSDREPRGLSQFLSSRESTRPVVRLPRSLARDSNGVNVPSKHKFTRDEREREKEITSRSRRRDANHRT